MAKQVSYTLASDDETFFRRVMRSRNNFDKATKLPTSRCFVLRPQDDGELSVDLSSLTSPEISVIDPTKYRLFAITHAEVRSCDTMGPIAGYHRPLPAADNMPENPAHGVIMGDNFTVDDDVTPGLLARKAKEVIIP